MAYLKLFFEIDTVLIKGILAILIITINIPHKNIYLKKIKGKMGDNIIYRYKYRWEMLRQKS